MPDFSLWRPRAYAQIEGRQQATDRLVTSENEIRLVLANAARLGRPANMRLATNIELTRPISIPDAVPRITLNGAGIFGFYWTASLPSVIRYNLSADHVVPDDYLAIYDVSFVTRPPSGGPYTTLFFEDATGFNIVSPTLRRVTIEGVESLFHPEQSVFVATFDECRFNIISGPFLNIKDTAGVGRITGSVFNSCSGVVDVDLNTLSEGNVFQMCDFSSGGLIDTTGTPTSVGTAFTALVACRFTSYTLNPNDLLVPVTPSGGTAPPARLPQGAFVGAGVPVAALPTTTSFAINGDSCIEYVAQATVTTTNATVTTILSIPTATDRGYFITIRCLGRQTAPAVNNTAVYTESYKAKNTAGVVTLSGALNPIQSEDVGTWNLAAAVSGTNVVVQVTGVAATTIVWDTTVIIDEV